MFTHLKNIDTAFKHIKNFSIVLIIGNAIVMCFGFYEYAHTLDRAENRIHILYNGKLLDAVASDRRTNLPVELRDHIKTFHEDFFTLVPDDKAIQENISKALYLADESAKNQYDDLREKGYYNNLVSANISQTISVDSIRLDLDHQPWSFVYYGTEKLTRSSNTVYRKLVTQGEIRELNLKTDNNPHGFLIGHWEVIANRDTTINQ